MWTEALGMDMSRTHKDTKEYKEGLPNGYWPIDKETRQLFNRKRRRSNKIRVRVGKEPVKYKRDIDWECW